MSGLEVEQLRSVFHRLLELPDDAARSRFLSEEVESEAMRERLEGLLSAHRSSADFLEPPTLPLPAGRTSSGGELDEPEPLPEGEILAGRHELGPLLGEGASGRVHRARDLVGARTVAVKILRPRVGERERERSREVAALRLLRFPGVVRLLDDGVHDGRTFLVTELVEGKPFPGLEAPVEWSRLRERTSALLAILDRLHRAGFIHRDLKPANVLVGVDGRVTVLDLGVAFHPIEREGSGDDVVGTPAYVAPEQMLGGRASARSDLYAVGVMLFEALVGELPFRGGNLDALLRARLSGETNVQGALGERCPPDVADLVASLLSPVPAGRPESASRVRELLGAAHAGGLDVLPRLLGNSKTLERVVAAGRWARSVDVWGAPGSGRSRLLREVAAIHRREGRKVLEAAAGAGVLAGLGALLEEPPAVGPFRIEEAVAELEPRLAAELAKGAVLLVDDADELDPWSRRLVASVRASGAVVRARTGVPSEPEDAVSLAPIGPADLRELFHGPEPILHLCSDAANLLFQRSGGLPHAVVAELTGWVDLGMALWDGEKLRVEREALDRLEIQPRALLPASRRERELEPRQARLLALAQVAGRHATTQMLAGWVGRPSWEVDGDLRLLAQRGALRARADGRLEVSWRVDPLRFLDGDELRRLHARIAEALPRGSAERSYHLLAGCVLEAIAEEALFGARVLRERGQAGAGLALLLETLAALAQGVSPAEHLPLLRALVPNAIEVGTEPALQQVLYVLETRSQGLVEVAALRDVARAALATTTGDAARGLALADGVEAFDDVDLELARQSVRVLAARLSGGDQEAKVLEGLEDWVGRTGDPRVERAHLSWLGWSCYRRGDYVEAARFHGRASDAAGSPALRLASEFTRASALMEAGRLVDAAEVAEAALVLAGTCRHPPLEARGHWIARCLAYRLDRAGEPRLDLVEAVAQLGWPDLEAGLRLNEAAVAWRLGRDEIAVEQSLLAAAAWRARGRAGAAALAEALSCAAGRAVGDDERKALAERAREAGSEGLVIQVLALLSDRSEALSSCPTTEVRALARALSPTSLSMRREVLSVEECLARVEGHPARLIQPGNKESKP